MSRTTLYSLDGAISATTTDKGGVVLTGMVHTSMTFTKDQLWSMIDKLINLHPMSRDSVIASLLVKDAM